MMPCSTSALSAERPNSLCTTPEPFSSTLNKNDTTKIMPGFSWHSQATMMAVKPTPPATPMERVMSLPATWHTPARPATAPERNMVRSTTRFTWMPA